MQINHKFTVYSGFVKPVSVPAGLAGLFCIAVLALSVCLFAGCSADDAADGRADNTVTVTEECPSAAHASCQSPGPDPDPDDEGELPDPVDPLAALSTSFDEALDSGWNIYNPASADIGVSGGDLVVTPSSTMLWYNTTATGTLVSRTISGDFMVTAGLTTARASDTASPPGASVKLAGVMARDPDTSSGHNYAFIVLGYDEDDLSVEVKTTVDSESSYDGPPWPDGKGQLRLCRVGNTFRFYIRAAAGDAWQLQKPPVDGPAHAWFDWSNFNDGVLTRTDLPASLEVGLNAYSPYDTDLQVFYHFIHFETPASAADCSL